MQEMVLGTVLVGPPDLAQPPPHARMRPLRERITERFHLGPLSATDVADYLAFRLRRAGGNPHLFEPRAVALIARASERPS